MVYVIAEIGSNHNGSLDTAKELIDAAKQSGCDCVKFQIFSADSLYSKNTKDFDQYKNVWQLIKGLEVPLSFFSEIKKHCDNIGIDFLASAFSTEAVDFLVEQKAKSIKIASFEFNDVRLIKYIVSKNIPIIASCGLSTTKDIENFLSWTKGIDVTLMHCNSSYPTPICDANLNVIQTLKRFNVKIGYSDHTRGILAPVVAVSLGANVIEKHITLSKESIGPDHFFAVGPKELSLMVSYIRETESLLGDSDIKITSSANNMLYARRSIFACDDIKAGDLFTEKNITTKRPNTGIPAEFYYNILGQIAKTNINKDSPIVVGHL